LALVILQILLTAGGQVLWKKSLEQSGGVVVNGQMLFLPLLRLVLNPVFLTGTILYGCATLLWFYLLSRFELSYIYPFLSLTFIVSFVGARLFLGETISFLRWAAVGLISLGVFLMTRS
jgi:drug/metabolite transporter (DMT)-like permease